MRDSPGIPGMLVEGYLLFLSVTHRIVNRTGISHCAYFQDSRFQKFRALLCGRKTSE